jgi:hypothetical protein
MTTVVPFKTADGATARPVASGRLLILNSPECSARLTRLADTVWCKSEVVCSRELVLGDRTEAEVRAALHALRVEAAPATKKEIARHCTALALTFSRQTVTEDQACVRFEIFCGDLGDITEHALACACAAYRTKPSKDGRQKFFPQAWELLDLAKDTMRDVRRRRRGLAKLEQAISTPPAVVGPIHPRERSIVEVMISISVAIILQHRLAAAREPGISRRSAPSTASAPLPHGRAQELRYVLARRLESGG